MAAIEDVLEEFKGATPGGKALMLVAIIAVAGVAYYVYKSKSSNNGTAGTLVPIDGGGSVSNGFGGGSSGSGTTTTPTPTVTPPIRTTGPVGNPAPAPTPAPAPAPPSGNWVTVTQWGTGSWSSTLWGMAQHYYGNGAMWGRIQQANNGVDPRNLHVGQRIFVPQ